MIVSDSRCAFKSQSLMPPLPQLYTSHQTGSCELIVKVPVTTPGREDDQKKKLWLPCTFSIYKTSTKNAYF